MNLLLGIAVDDLPKFSVNLGRIAFIRRLIESSFAWMQSFVLLLKFTQLVFCSDIGIGLHTSAVSAAGTIHEESSFEPQANLLPKGHEATVFDLKNTYDDVAVRREDARDTSERWFGVNSVESSDVGESSGHQGVRFSNVVEVGVVESLLESVHALQIPNMSFIAKSPAKDKRKRNATPTPGLPKRRFEFDDESVLLPK